MSVPKDTHLSGDGERLEEIAEWLFRRFSWEPFRGKGWEKLAADKRKVWRVAAAELRDLATRLSPENSDKAKGEPFEDDDLDESLGKDWRRAVAVAFLNLAPTRRESILRDLGCDSMQQVRARKLVAALAAKLDALPENSSGVEEAVKRLWARAEEEKQKTATAFDERDKMAGDREAADEANLLDDFHRVLGELFPRCGGDGFLGEDEACPGCPECMFNEDGGRA